MGFPRREPEMVNFTALAGFETIPVYQLRPATTATRRRYSMLGRVQRIVWGNLQSSFQRRETNGIVAHRSLMA